MGYYDINECLPIKIILCNQENKKINITIKKVY